MPLIEFIEKYEPKFRKKESGWEIFTVPTQHVNKPTLLEAIEFCHYVIREQPILKYPTISELIKEYNSDKSLHTDGCTGYFEVRHGDVGYNPGVISEKELVILCSDEWQKKQSDWLNILMWGKEN